VTLSNMYRPTDLLTPGEVARLLRVDAKTPTRWARSREFPCIVTPGGHRRFYYAAVRAVMDGHGKRGAWEAHNAIITHTPDPTDPTPDPTD
jgi:excisionase family DNA binding protein